MLTAREINNVSFARAGISGYKPEDVDNFIDKVVESYGELMAKNEESERKLEELAAKNAELQEKLTVLAQKIEGYRRDEDEIKEAILSAQKLGRESIDEAKRKAEVILSDAKEAARRKIDNAKAESIKLAKLYVIQTEQKKKELEETKKQVSAFRVSLLEAYKKHLEIINSIPGIEEELPQKRVEPEEDSSAKEEEVTYEAGTDFKEAIRAQEAARFHVVTPPSRREEPTPQAEEQLPVAQKPADEPPLESEPTFVRNAKASEQSEPTPVKNAVPEAEEVPQQQTFGGAEPLPFTDTNRMSETAQIAAVLKQRLDHSRRAAAAPERPDEDYSIADDATEMGLDVNAYADIPETLKKEKDSRFDNLEFGDGVDLYNKK